MLQLTSGHSLKLQTTHTYYYRPVFFLGMVKRFSPKKKTSAGSARFLPHVGWWAAALHAKVLPRRITKPYWSFVMGIAVIVGASCHRAFVISKMVDTTSGDSVKKVYVFNIANFKSR